MSFFTFASPKVYCLDQQRGHCRSWKCLLLFLRPPFQASQCEDCTSPGRALSRALHYFNTPFAMVNVHVIQTLRITF